MNHITRTVSPEALFADYSAILATPGVDALPVMISGNSMAPFLKHGRDTVFLSRIERPIRRGDMILYRRPSGAYILHRVYKVKDGSLTMIGDAQITLEPCIPIENAIATVTSVTRKGKLLTQKSLTWLFYERIWLTLVPLRPFIFKLHSILKRSARKEDGTA